LYHAAINRQLRPEAVDADRQSADLAPRGLESLRYLRALRRRQRCLILHRANERRRREPYLPEPEQHEPEPPGNDRIVLKLERRQVRGRGIGQAAVGPSAIPARTWSANPGGGAALALEATKSMPTISNLGNEIMVSGRSPVRTYHSSCGPSIVGL
jgi:hypothetical protein